MMKGRCFSHNRIITEIVRFRQQNRAATLRQQLFSPCCLPHHPSYIRSLGAVPRAKPYEAMLQQRLSEKHHQTTKAMNMVRWHGDSSAPHNDDAPTVNVTFLQPDGTTHTTVTARIGESLLQTAHRHEIDLEGACEGVCACSTCHVIAPRSVYDALPDASENEEDMLDMAFGLTETSRLGCQIKVTSEMDGIVFEMPKATRNFYVDGHKPKPH